MDFRWLKTAGSLLVTTCLHGQSLIQAPAGQVVVYEGTVKMAQIVEEATQSEGAYSAGLVVIVRDSGPGKVSLAAIRGLRPDDTPERNLFDFTTVSLTSTAESFQLEAEADPAAELEPSSTEIRSLLPLVLFPSSAEEGPAGVTSSVTLSLLGSDPFKALVVTRAAKAGEAIEVKAALQEATSPELKLQGSPSRLTAWTQTYHFDGPAKSLPRKIEAGFSIVGEIGGTKSTIRQNLVLTLKSAWAAQGENASKIESFGKDLQDLESEFQAAGPASGLEKLVESFAVKAKGTPFEAAVEPLKGRLEAYKSLGIGTLAHDFTLEDLQGKKVSFREATRGKVTLLSFWGVG